MNGMIVLDFPLLPPSVNSIWKRNRQGGVYLCPKYKKWRADCVLWTSGQFRRSPFQPIEIDCRAHIVLDEKLRRGDADNRTKAVLDFCQGVGAVKNDKLVKKVTTEWAACSVPCRVTLIPIGGENGTEQAREGDDQSPGEESKP